MLVVHLASSLLFAVALALWGSLAGYSMLACLGLYMLGGNVGLVASAALQILGSGRPGSTRSR